MYLMKIQIYFLFRKNFRFVFNENKNMFLIQKKKKFKYVFNENTDLFFLILFYFFYF